MRSEKAPLDAEQAINGSIFDCHGIGKVHKLCQTHTGIMQVNLRLVIRMPTMPVGPIAVNVNLRLSYTGFLHSTL